MNTDGKTSEGEGVSNSKINTLQAKHFNNGVIVGSLLGSINFDIEEEEKVSFLLHKSFSLDKMWIDPKIIKTQMEVAVKKSFALDINLSAVEGKSAMAKTYESMRKAVSLAEKEEIVITNDVRKQELHSDQAVVIKEIPIDMPKEMIVVTVSEFGQIKSIKIQLSFLIGKNLVRVAITVEDHNTWASRDWFRVLLFTLPVGTTAYDFGNLLEKTSGKTCIINYLLENGNRFHCAVVGFKSNEGLDSVFLTEPIFGGMCLLWTRLDLVWCGKCEHIGHSILECDALVESSSGLPNMFKKSVSGFDHLQLARLYAKKNVPISRSAAFGGKSWAQVVFLASPFGGSSSGSGLLFSGKPLSFGFSGPQVNGLGDHLAVLEHSLEILSDQVSVILKKLSFVDLVPLASTSRAPPVAGSVFLALVVGLNMALDDVLAPSIPFLSSYNKSATGLSSSGSRVLTSKVGGLEFKLSALEASFGSILARLDLLCSDLGFELVWKFTMCNIWSLSVPAKQVDTKLRSSVGPWIKDKYEGVRIFTSGLDIGFLGTGVAIIMNNFLAHHVSKVEEVPGCVVAVWLLFKNKLSVSVIGLYAGASTGVCFGQASEINSLIAKAVNSNIFVVLGGNFNKNGSGRSVNFRFCSSLGLINSFSGYFLVGATTWGNSRGVKRTIDFIFVSENLVSAVAGHKIGPVLDFFNTDHNTVMVSVGLEGFLNVHLNSLRKQANKNCWKFNIKDTDVTGWSCFKDCSSVKVLGIKDNFLATAAKQDLDAMWFLLEKMLVDSADETFSRCWFSEFQCLKNKQSSRFMGLELLIVKIVKKFGSANVFGFDCLVKKWSTLDATKALVLMDMIQSGQKKDAVLKFLSVIKKEYRKSKLYESNLAQEASIREAIEKRMRKFCSNKGSMIRSVLNQPFRKVVLDHLVINNKLILEPEEIKLKVDIIMEDWMRKQIYASLAHVKNNAFSGVMSAITLDELLLVVGGLPDGKAAVPALWKRAWVSIIPKPYDWDGVLTNTCPIALLETARKILSKILLDRIFFACNRFGVLHGDNFSVLKGMSTQSPVFAVGSVVENALEKNRELWLVLQDMCKAYDSGEVFSPLLWRIFYDPLLCEVKRHEHLCGYHIDTKFVAKTSRIENSGGMSSFFAAGTFVDDTIWVGDCQASMQYALNITSEFFYINDISINNEKTGVKIAVLSISGRPISIVRKGKAHRYLKIFLSTEGLSKLSLAKAYSDVHFFVNRVLRKVITDKQFSYLVLAVLQPIVSYRIQFSFVSSGICRKWDVLVRKGFRSKARLPCDFPDAALHYPSLYGLKSFEQVQSEGKMASLVSFANASGILGCLFEHRVLDLQVLSWAPLNPLQYSVKLHVSLVNNFLAGVVKIFMNIDLSLVNNLPNAFCHPGHFPMPSILGKSLYFDSVRFFKHFGVAFSDWLFDKKELLLDWKTFCHWKRLDPWGSVPLWFTVASKYFLDQGLFFSRPPVVIRSGGVNILESDVFSSMQDGLHKVWSGCFETYMDGSLKGAGSADVSSGAIAYFPALGLGVGIKVCGLLSFTMAELQAVALALECVPSSSSVVLYLDNQAAIDACVSEMLLKVPVAAGDKDLRVSWVKVKGHAGVFGNVEADRFAGKAACSSFVLPMRIQECFLVADDTVVLGNVCHFEAGLSWDVVSADMLGDFDWAASAKVWHPDSHMLAGFTSRKLANLRTYLMKALHKRLPVAVRKRLYNKCYPGVQCLLCGEVELPDHVFTYLQDVHIQGEILLEASAWWVFLVGVYDLFASSVLQVLDSCHSDIGRYSVLCKDFVLKVWCMEAAGVFDDVKETSRVVIDFVRFLTKLHQSRVWLVRSKFRADMERAGLVGDDGLVSSLSHCVSSVLSDGMVRMLGIAEFFAISFGHLRPCLFFLGLDGGPYVNISV
ncbi:hypothetical protein G9A89_005082 [Geosiphon pyriformis]|nr:hypothetical protein G9A89_005082 [Geosiphon pyriformis]